MPCYRPIKAYQYGLTKTGKVNLVFKSPTPGAESLKVPCGQCWGCRLERSRQWAIRCVHEASLYEENCFITLTYNPDNLPEDMGLNKAHFQKFMKRLRKEIHPRKVRYFHCGEYGEKNLRPHYHACLFGYDFPAKTLFTTRSGINLYNSSLLDRLWPYGFSSIGDVTFESAAYVARYIMKKINVSETTPEKYRRNYERVDPETGEVFDVQPEYTTMSRRPGIGAGWIERYREDTYKDDTVIIRGKPMQPPKYYDGFYEDIDAIKKRRRINAEQYDDNNTPSRLRVREKCKREQTKQLKRSLDED